MIALWCIFAALASVALGYCLRVLHERRIEAAREHAVAALGGGELPDWERRARELEDGADQEEIDGSPRVAREKRQRAARLRRVALRRIRRGLKPLPEAFPFR